jgi:hypothetical protein
MTTLTLGAYCRQLDKLEDRCWEHTTMTLSALPRTSRMHLQSIWYSSDQNREQIGPTSSSCIGSAALISTRSLWNKRQDSLKGIDPSFVGILDMLNPLLLAQNPLLVSAPVNLILAAGLGTLAND